MVVLKANQFTMVAQTAMTTKLEATVVPKNGSWESTAGKHAIFAIKSNLRVFSNVSSNDSKGTKSQ